MKKISRKVKCEDAVMQAIFSAVLYLLNEQQSLMGRLLQVLLDNGDINSHQLEKITDITGGDEGLVPVYSLLYNRFAKYFLKTKKLLEEQGISFPEPGEADETVLERLTELDNQWEAEKQKEKGNENGS
jgi:hypothetical protein